jgi:osmoprotectant transport system permease protein
MTAAARLILLWATLPDGGPADVRIGSKAFTESVVLGELIAHVTEGAGGRPVHRKQLGGTEVLWAALVKGEIDVYPEYTGTIAQEILSGEKVTDDAAMRDALARHGVRMSRSLGFNNTYAIGMKADVAARLGVRTISDLVRHPELQFGFSNEFMDRGDGWPSLRDRYRLPQRDVRGLDHDLAYRAIESGGIDATDLYSTDAEIRHYNLTVLDDDLRHFPPYRAILLYRADLQGRAPEVVSALLRLEDRIDEPAMIRMNARAKIDKVPESQVAADFAREVLGIAATAVVETRVDRLLRHTAEHLALVAVSLAAAIVVALPLGVVAARLPAVGQVILAAAGVIQTVPSLALLVFFIPLLGIGGPPAIVALFLYSLLPIVRNTYAGLHDIAPQFRESAEALGLPAGARLRLVELPMASRAILAGIKTSAVINVGTATLGAVIGAGGYGQPILTGIRLDDTALILEGAVPAAALALAVQGLFELAERRLVPAGLRLQREKR